MDVSIRATIVAAALGGLGFGTTARAVLVFSGTPEAPTVSRQLADVTPPPAGSGLQYIGLYGTSGETRFLGVPISPHHFVTAKHVYSPGTGLTIGPDTYAFSQGFLDPSSDLAIVEITGTFPTYAPLYTGSGEVGLTMTAFGRGKTAGTLFSTGGVNNGWKIDDTSVDDRQISWATDTIDAANSGLLLWDFTPTAGSSSLTDKDSGGPVFVNDGGVWKLAGVNFGISSPFSQHADGSDAFSATVFNAHNLYMQDSSVWVPVDGPGVSAATRISSRQEWIASIVPEPATATLLAACLLAGLRRRR